MTAAATACGWLRGPTSRDRGILRVIACARSAFLLCGLVPARAAGSPLRRAAHRPGDKRPHFEMAAGNASEATVALRIAVAKRYVAAGELAELEVVLDRVRAMLYRLTR
jgi:hypothetical protein